VGKHRFRSLGTAIEDGVHHHQAWPPLVTYHVVTSCTGPYEGRTFQFGRDEQDVSG
jgi:hypothetical protein